MITTNVIVDDSNSMDDVKVVPGSFETWDVVDQLEYIHQQQSICAALLENRNKKSAEGPIEMRP